MLAQAQTLVSRPLIQPAVVGCAAVGATLAAFAFTPGSSSLLPTCPVYAATGIFCPGCGTTRALHALTHGDVATALHNNALFVIALPLLIYAWFSWTAERRGSQAIPMPKFGRWVGIAIAVTVLAFGILRNINVEPLTWLAPIPV